MTAGAIPPVSAVAAAGTAAGTGSVLAGSVGGITAVVGVESTLAGSVAGAYLDVSIPFFLSVHFDQTYQQRDPQA